MHRAVILVPYIPKFADVKLTSLVSVVKEARLEGQEWASNDMRAQILLLTHECCMHAKPSAMLRALEHRVWWPSLWNDCVKHHDACSLCIPMQNVAKRPGMSLVCTKRFALVGMDHVILSPDIASRTGCPAILTMIDVAGTMVVGRPVKDVGSVTTCISMVCGWIAYFGGMQTLRIDGGSGLASQVTKFVAELFGVDFIDVGAADEHEHSAHVENVHKDLRNELDRAELKGELRSYEDD